MSSSNTFIYISTAFAAIYVIIHLYALKKLPNLVEIFSTILSMAAGYSSIELFYYVLEGSKKLGDFQDQKLFIVLGFIAVFWVSLQTVIAQCKAVVVAMKYGKVNAKAGRDIQSQQNS